MFGFVWNNLSAAGTASLLKGIFYGIGYLVRGDVIFHMVGKKSNILKENPFYGFWQL